MKFRITHITRYRYNLSVSQCYNEAHLTLRNTPLQNVLTSTLEISPAPADKSSRVDGFGNHTTFFHIDQAHKTLEVTAHSSVELLADRRGPPPAISVSDTRKLVDIGDTLDALEAQEYVLPSPFIPKDERFQAFAESVLKPNTPIADAVGALMSKIYKEFTYDPQFTDLATPLGTVLEHKRGVCQDFAHFAIACLRSHGIPARYVSGYLETVPPPGQKKLEGADESHAWFAVFIPNYGWLDFDPTNDLIPSDQHITLAWGRDYSDVSPLKGIIYGGGNHTLEVSVTVQKLEQQQQQQSQQQ